MQYAPTTQPNSLFVHKEISNAIFIMGGVLVYYNLKIFAIFFIGSFMYFLWIVLFLKRREKLDYKRFSAMSEEQSKVIELINGMQEIKLYNAERQKRWGWEYLQARLFRVSVKGLGLEQTQNIGSSFINELKNIFIIFLSAKLVVEGQMTLGIMMAVSSIVGNLNSPIVQLIAFIRDFQDAKISLNRLLEIHEKEDENINIQSLPIPKNAEIVLENVSFSYIGSDRKALDDISLTILANKTTAIVGASGSGKTTLMKLLLKFYEPTKGNIYLSNTSQKNDLQHISQKDWRNHVGVVMQEGYIFNDTIAGNIAVGVENIDLNKLLYSTETANIQEFIKKLPLGFNTKIGMEGVGMSTGQKQRILIARAVYKNPEILFFDEATSALDANNEKIIMKHLERFYENKTVVIIAHRLSTVKNADQIIVLDSGKIVEQGTHNDLVIQKGIYFHLVKNQLELGN